MNKDQAARLTGVKTVKGQRFVFVRPGIVATFYLDAPVAKAASAIADAVPSYLDFVGSEAIHGYLAQNGTYKQFSNERLQRDLKVMRSASPKAPGPDLEYSSEANGTVGPFGISVRGSDNDDVFPLSVSLLRLEFPELGSGASHSIERLVDFVMREAVELRAQSGSVGWGFKRAPAFTREATEMINTLLPRYLCFDPCYGGFGRQMRNKTPPPNWVTFVRKPLFAQCGGQDRLSQVAPSARSVVVGDMVFLRAAKMPPIGDTNRGAKDIGAIPDVARFLKPLRVTIGGLGDQKFDAAAWLSRFDEVASRPWDNE